MTRDEQIEYLDQQFGKIHATLAKKGNDYANADRLSNFKYSGDITGVSAVKATLLMVAIKVARLGNLLDSPMAPNNESIEDSIQDLQGYSLLLGMVVEDMKKPQVGDPLTITSVEVTNTENI